MTTIPAHAECGRADAVIPYGVHGPATKWLCRRCRLTFGEADSMPAPAPARVSVTDADRAAAWMAHGKDMGISVGEHPLTWPGKSIAQAIADARATENKACVEIMGQVIADNGCDCDFDAPHEGIPCEEHGHDPCLACRMERALNTIIARRTT